MLNEKEREKRRKIGRKREKKIFKLNFLRE
jgi:hypothetical protein